MKLKISIMFLILIFLIVSCMPKNIDIETPSQVEQPIEDEKVPESIVKKPITKPVTVSEPVQEGFPAALKEYRQEGTVYEARNDRYKVRIIASTRSLDFTAPMFAYNIADKISFIETGDGQVKDIKKISSNIVPEETSDYEELFRISDAASDSKIYERDGIIIEASPTRYIIRDDQNFKKLTFFTASNIALEWGDKVRYRIDDRGNIVTVRITSKYLPY